MVQKRGAGDGKVGNQPAGDDIAEVDDAVRHQAALAVGAGDDIVVGDVVVDRLDPELARQRLDALDGGDHRLGDPVAPFVVGHGLQEVQGDGAGTAKVPLQFAIQSGMRKVLEAPRNARGQSPEFGHHLWRQIFALGQRFAVEIGEQPRLIVLVVDGHEDDVFATARKQGLRNAGHVLDRREMSHGGILGGELDRCIFGAADLEDEDPIFGLDPEIAVLLAAEFLQATFEAKMLPEDQRRLLDRYVRARQLCALEQRGVGHGSSPSGIT